MKISCNIIDSKFLIFEVVTTRAGKENKTQGHFRWDPSQGEQGEWTADELLLKCLELFVSDERIRKGYLGTNFKTARKVAMEVAGAWETVAYEGTSQATLQVPKLDLDTSDLLELFPSYRPLKDLIQEHA